MGANLWSDSAYSSLRADYSTKTRDQIFKQRGLHKDMDPKGITFRESRDSIAHPNSIAIAVNVDVTGSMGSIPEFLIKEKLGKLMNTLISHGVPDAHVLFGGIGDQYSDKAPLQVGQFEAGTDELDECLTKIYLEGNGGGQNKESYSLAWLMAARHTSIDCFEKRNQKGFLFTIGDEGVHDILEKEFLTELLGYEVSENISAKQLLSEAQRMYNVFHLHITETSTGRKQSIIDSWKSLLGERAIMVDDYNNLSEIIATTVAVILGESLQNVVASFDRRIANSVTNALSNLSNDIYRADLNDGVLTL